MAKRGNPRGGREKVTLEGKMEKEFWHDGILTGNIIWIVEILSRGFEDSSGFQ